MHTEILFWLGGTGNNIVFSYFESIWIFGVNRLIFLDKRIIFVLDLRTPEVGSDKILEKCSFVQDISSQKKHLLSSKILYLK